MNWLINNYRTLTRALAWLGIVAIIVLSVVPADERPVTGTGQTFEHFAAFALVAAAFTVSYRFSFAWLLLLAFFFCGGIELLQVPLPTRHARLSDFVIDFVGTCVAIGFVAAGDKIIGAYHMRRQRSRRPSDA